MSLKLSLKIINTYPGDEVINHETVTVEDPPASREEIEAGDSAEGEDWVMDNLFPLTGTGRSGSAFYEIIVVGSSDPAWLGFKQEWDG